MLKGQIIGNLGGEPELRYSQSGAPFLRFNVASNSRVRDQDGEYRDRTEWVRVTVFGNRAEALTAHLKKGSRVYVDGRLEARPWTDRENNVRAGLELIGDTVELLSPREESDQGDESPREAPRQQRQPAAAGASRQSAPQRSQPDDELEDLPF